MQHSPPALASGLLTKTPDRELGYYYEQTGKHNEVKIKQKSGQLTSPYSFF